MGGVPPIETCKKCEPSGRTKKPRVLAARRVDPINGARLTVVCTPSVFTRIYAETARNVGLPSIVIGVESTLPIALLNSCVLKPGGVGRLRKSGLSEPQCSALNREIAMMTMAAVSLRARKSATNGFVEFRKT